MSHLFLNSTPGPGSTAAEPVAGQMFDQEWYDHAGDRVGEPAALH